MKKNCKLKVRNLFLGRLKLWRIMNLSACLFLLMALNVYASGSDSQSAMAQDQTVTGKVLDETGAPLPGVSIMIQGTTRGAVTNLEGEYTIQVPDPSTTVLVFSFVGYLTQEISISDQTTIDIAMEPDIYGVEEVVVIGYGTQKKVNLTGSVSAIEGDQLAKQPVFQSSQALVGLAPGLTAIQSSSQPGKDAATLLIRGVGSLTASNNPLVLIDGIEGDINGVDANDIESISVLKDASASSIYGSRASNGVILVTTNRAKSGELSVNYRNWFGWQKATETPQYLGALDFMKYSGYDQAVIDDYAANLGDPDRYPDTDWYAEQITESGFQQYHQISLNGGTENVRTLASFSYMDQGANVVNFNYKRYNGRLNTDIKFSDKFDMNFDVSFRRSITTEPSIGLTWIFQAISRIPPIYTARYSDGSWGEGWDGNNPIAFANDGGIRESHSNYFVGRLRANYSPIPGLKFSIMYAPEYSDGYLKRFARTYEAILDWDTKITKTVPDRNSLSQRNDRSFTGNFNALATFEKSFSGHNVTALAGYELIQFQSNYFTAGRTDFTLQDYQELNAGSEDNDSNSGSATHSALVSYFGRVNYSYEGKYLLEANIRRDASSRFAPENRIGIFPAFSAAWRISEESFLQDSEVISNLKLRGSWGQLGNQQIGSDFPYVSAISLGGSNNFMFGGNIVTGAAQNVLANNFIQWETAETFNIGLDMGLFNESWRISADYYIKKTNDVLILLPIPALVGLSPSIQNAGDVENRGWDFSLEKRGNIGDFAYSARVLLSSVKNEVTDLADVGPIISGNSYTQVGHPIGMIYGYESSGMFQDAAEIADAPSQFGSLIPGNIRYKDQITVDTNGDGIPDEADGLINSDDRVPIGNPFPRMEYSLGLGADYKGFDLSVSLNGVGKRDVRLSGDAVWALFNAGKIQEWHVKECWSPENTGASFPIISSTSSGSNDIQTSSTWVFNASYFRVRNVTFGYTLPSTLLDKIFVKQMRVYFSGQNMFTFHNMPEGLDPLVPNGSNASHFPITAVYTFGVNINF